MILLFVLNLFRLDFFYFRHLLIDFLLILLTNFVLSSFYAAKIKGHFLTIFNFGVNLHRFF